MVTPDPWGLAGRRLYLCTPDRPDLDRFVEACIGGGVDVVQLREKHLDDRQLSERALVVHRICRRHGVPFILNDRPDLAVAIGADGVHVGQDDVSPAEARRLVGPDAIVGLSTHATSELGTAIGHPVSTTTAAADPRSPLRSSTSRPVRSPPRPPSRDGPAPDSTTSVRR